MSNDLNLALRLSADPARLLGGLAKGEGGLRKFGSAAKREMDAFRHAASSVEGKLAQLGLGISAIAAGVQSARLDKDLTQLKLTAGATADEAGRLRKELLGAQIATGQGADELKAGVDSLIAGGLSMAEATATVAPMAETLAVAKTNADALAKAMGVAGKQFNIDLSQTESARLLLDKMVVAGRAGNAELENLPDIFARVGGNAKSANMSLDQTLALVETLSLVEPNAERLATLTDSTLRVFTNANYMKSASKATGIKFFDAEGSRRDALDVIGDIKGQYDKLSTDRERFGFISKAFGQTDLDTQRGLKTLLDGNSLSRLDDIFADVSTASGTIARDLPEAIGNAVDQTGRLKGALREAADEFAKPINNAMSEAIKFGLDKDNGGLGLSGGEIMVGGALGAAGLFGAARYGGKAIKGLAGKFGSTAAGVATGKALEEVAGVQPVFVVNMPGEFGGGFGTPDKLAGSLGEGGSLLAGASRFGLPGLGVTAAGAAGYGVGSVANMGIDGGLSLLAGRDTSLGGLLYDLVNGEREESASAGGALAKGAGWLASPIAMASQTLSMQLLEAIRGSKAEPVDVGGQLAIHVTSEGQAKVTELRSNSNVDLTVYTGRTGAGR